MASFVMPFSSLVCMRTPVWWGTHEPWTLAMIRNKDCWSRNTVSTCLETGVWTDVTNTAYLYWGSLWRQTCCSVIVGKLMHLLLKEVTETRVKNVTRCRDSKIRRCYVVYRTVICYHPYLVSLFFLLILSLHLVTFLMFFSLVYIIILPVKQCCS